MLNRRSFTRKLLCLLYKLTISISTLGILVAFGQTRRPSALAVEAATLAPSPALAEEEITC